MTAEAAPHIAALGRLVASGESYAEALDLLLSDALTGGWWDGEADGEDALGLALTDAAEAALAGLDPEDAARRRLAPAPAPAQKPASRGEALAVLNAAVREFFEDAAAFVTIRRRLAAGRAKAEAAHPKGSPERRAALKALSTAMRRDYGPDWSGPGRRVLLPAPAGSGKSTLAATLLRKYGARLGVVWFLLPTGANVAEVAALIPGAIPVHGRGADDPDDPAGGKMCARHEAADRVARAGLPVGQTLCDDGNGHVCPFFAGCAYQRSAAEARAAEAGIYVATLNYAFTPGAPMPRADLVIMDETFVARAVSTTSFGLDRLLPDNMPDWRRAGRALTVAYRETAVKVRDALTDPAGILASLRARGITAREDSAAAIAYLDAAEDRGFTGGIAPDMPDAEVLSRLDALQRNELGAIRAMLAALRDEIELPRDQAHAVTFNPDCLVKVNGRAERQARIFVHRRRRLSIADDVPMLLLDASADAEICRRLVGDRLEAVGVQCERNAIIVQVRDTANARTSLLGHNGDARSEDTAGRRLTLTANVANGIAARHGEAFLATYAKVEPVIAPKLAGNVLTGHFGKIRGQNLWERCTAGIILGREQPKALAVEAMTRALHSDDPEPLNLTGAYVREACFIRLKDGSMVPVEVDVHPDQRVQRVLELCRERESEQAIDRLRLIHNANPKVI